MVGCSIVGKVVCDIGNMCFCIGDRLVDKGYVNRWEIVWYKGIGNCVGV